MNIIIDTNILISALLKNSTTRRIIIECNERFFAPEAILDEIDKHMNMILRKSGMDKETFNKIISILLSYIERVPTEEIMKNIEKARKIMEKVDPDDVIFIAAALTKNAVIWSDDSDFQKQSEIKVLKTKDIIRMIYRR